MKTEHQGMCHKDYFLSTSGSFVYHFVAVNLNVLYNHNNVAKKQPKSNLPSLS